MAFLLPVLPFITAATAVAGLGLAVKSRSDLKKATPRQTAALSSLAPPQLPTGPTAAQAETQRLAEETARVKTAADKRAADIKAGIAADTAAAGQRRSLIGLSATIRTSPAGLKGKAPVERKTLLGQGGFV